jgi:hypothetical protein
MWDIIIAVLLWLLTAATAYMGFHVTLHPPEPGSKGFWKAGFIVVAILAAILIAIQAYRSYNSAQDLKAEIQKQGADTRETVREEGSRPIKVEMPPTVEPESSLRRRALKLAAELAAFDKERSKDYPGYTVTNKMTAAEQEAITKPAKAYDNMTYQLYQQRYVVPTVGIVQEFKAKGMDVSAIEQQAQYGYRLAELVTSLRAMAGRLDERGDIKR